MASIITATAHGLAVNDTFKFANVLPTDSGVNEATTYYVLTVPTADTFTFSTSQGGTAFVLSRSITDGSIVTAESYTAVADGVMDPPAAVATPSAVTLESATVSSIVRLIVTINDAPEAKLRLWEVQVTHLYDDEVPIVGSVTGVAATDLFTLTGHGLNTGDPVRFTALTGGTGITVDTTYYVIASGLTADAFRVSTAAGGSTIDFTTDVTAGTVADVVTPFPVWTSPTTLSIPSGSSEMSIPALGATKYAGRARAQDVYGNFSEYGTVTEFTTAVGPSALALPDGAVNESMLAVGSVSTAKLQARAVTADILSATIVLTSLLKTADSGRRVEIDQYGVRLLDSDNSLIVNIPTNSAEPVYFRGAIVAESFSSLDENDLSGAIALSGDGILTLANGVAAPTVAPTIAASLDSLALTSTPADLGVGIGYDSGAGTYWVAADPTLSGHYVAHEFNATTGVYVRSIAATGSSTTYTATAGSTSHVGDSWEATSGSTNSQIANPMTMPTTGRITRIRGYASGYGGNCTARVAVWDSGGNLLRDSANFTFSSESPSAGAANLFNEYLDSELTVSGGTTIWVGFLRTSSGDGFWWDRDGGSGKTTKKGDGLTGDMTSVSTDSSNKPNISFTYEYDVDTRLETAKMIGVCTDGTYIYTLDTLGQVWKYDRTTLAYVANSAVQTAITGTKTQAGMFYDATATELIITTTTGTGAGVYPKFVRVTPSTLAVSSTVYSAAAGTTFSGTTDTFRGGARLADPLNANAATYWVATTSAVYAYTFSGTTATQTSDRHFGTAATVASGLTYDGTQFRGWAVATPTKVWKFTGWDWTTASAVYWVAYAWYDSAGTTHETAVSPRSSLTLRRRERLQVTTPAIPTGGADDPDNARTYMKPNATDPGAGAFKLQATDTGTSRYLTDYASGGAADGAGTAFPSGSPAEIRSSVAQGSGGWSFKGDGSLAGKAPVITIYTSSDTWTRPAGCNHIIVEVVGGGGGGGGITASATGGHGSTGSGGGGGGYSRRVFTDADLDADSTGTVTVGAAAAGGNAAAGAAGATNSFVLNGVTVQATGGAGGGRGPDRSGINHETSSAGGIGSGGTVNLQGDKGHAGFYDGLHAQGGPGGASRMGGGAPSTRADGSSTVGTAGGAYGGGGSGACSDENATNRVGGDGAVGCVIVTEFYAP